MTDSIGVEIVAASATMAAVAVALWTSHRALQFQQRSVRAEGQRQAAVEISRWLQSAETGLLAWHDPENWRIPADAECGSETGIEPGDVLPPSQGRMGPSVETALTEFDSVKGLARLAFGPTHEVTSLVDQVITAIQHVADRGVIYAEGEVPNPREYVDRTFRPLVADAFAALAEACELRDHTEHKPRSRVRASGNR